MNTALESMTRARGALVGVIAAVTAGAMVLLSAPSPGAAEDLGSLENQSQIVHAGETGFTAPSPEVPAVESLLGRGSPLATAQQVAADAATGRVALGGQAAKAKSALVRVTLLDPAADTVVFTTASLSSLEDNDGTGKVDPNNALELDAAATALLHAAAGTSASTTVLLPATHGGVPLFADQGGAAVRVETLATFAETENAPGATIALATPELRADTAQGLGGVIDAGAEPLWVGLTGAGSMEGSLARSVYVNLDLTLDTAGDIDLSDGQTLTLPKGRSIVTTIVEPDAAGGVTIDLSAGTASLRASVLGWVTEAGEDFSSANVNGSYVVSVEAPRSISFKPGKSSAKMSLSGNGDADYAIALVNGVTTGKNSESTTLTSLPLTGRATGTAFDRAVGASPQLALVPVTDGDATLTLRRSAADVTVQPLGALLGEPTGYDKQNPATVEITSPSDRKTIDLSEHGYFTLEGVADAGANAIDRVEITARDEQGGNTWVGLAELDFDDDQVVWRLNLLAPDDGKFDYTATVYDRSDRSKPRASDSLLLDVSLPDASDEVTSPELVVIDQSMQQPRAADENTLIFPERPPLEPGNLVVTYAIDGAESGFFARVSQINQLDEQWIVSTVQASITDMVFQSDVEETIDYQTVDMVDQIRVEDVPDSGAAPSTFATGELTQFDEDGNETGTQATGYQVLNPGDLTDSAGLQSGDPAVQTGLDEWPGDLPNDSHAALLRGDDVDLKLDANDFNLEDAGIDPSNPDEFALGCRMPGSDTQEPTGDQIDDDGNWSGDNAGEQAPSGAVPNCGLQGGISGSSSFSIGMNAKFIVGLKNGKPQVLNATKLEKWEFDRWQQREAENNFAIGVEGSGQVVVSLDFALRAHTSWSWKPWKTKIVVDEFKVQLTSTLKANAALSVYAEAKGRMNFKLEVARIQLPQYVFLIGPVPIVITNVLNSAIGASAELKASLTMPAVGLERVDTFGFVYSSNGGMRRIKNDTPTTYVVPSFKSFGGATGLELAGNIAVGPEITYASRIYTFAGPDITVFAQAGVSGKIAKTTADFKHYRADIEVFLAYGLDGSVKLTLLRWQILNLTLFNLGVRINLFKKGWDFTI